MSTPLLSVTDLTIAYGRIQVVHGVSFQVAAGAVTCLIGPNGAGKTTTLKGILGLLKPLTGRADLEGKRLTGLSPDAIARLGVGTSPEGRRVFPSLSVLDNLRMGAVTRRVRWQHPEGMDAVFTLFPELERHLHKPAGLLSGGEQQMLAIGRALMLKPRLLVLDEPSMGLAPKLVARIYAALAGLKGMGVSILLVEQNARMALSISDWGYVLESGRVVESGAAADLGNSPRVREIYLGA